MVGGAWQVFRNPVFSARSTPEPNGISVRELRDALIKSDEGELMVDWWDRVAFADRYSRISGPLRFPWYVSIVGDYD